MMNKDKMESAISFYGNIIAQFDFPDANFHTSYGLLSME